MALDLKGKRQNHAPCVLFGIVNHRGGRLGCIRRCRRATKRPRDGSSRPIRRYAPRVASRGGAASDLIFRRRQKERVIAISAHAQMIAVDRLQTIPHRVDALGDGLIPVVVPLGRELQAHQPALPRPGTETERPPSARPASRSPGLPFAARDREASALARPEFDILVAIRDVTHNRRRSTRGGGCLSAVNLDRFLRQSRGWPPTSKSRATKNDRIEVWPWLSSKWVFTIWEGEPPAKPSASAGSAGASPSRNLAGQFRGRNDPQSCCGSWGRPSGYRDLDPQRRVRACTLAEP